MNTDKKRILAGESRTGLALFLCCLGCLLFKSATARADTASYVASDGASYTSAKLYSFCPTAPNVFASATHVWHLGEASGNARADSVGSLTLSESGGTIPNATGVHGNCADLISSGTKQLVSASSSIATGSDPWSVAFWFKPHTLPPGVESRSIFSWGSGDGTFTIYFENTIDGGVIDPLFNADGSSGTVALGSLDAWHLVVVVADPGSGLNASVDGAALAALAGLQAQDAGGPASVGDNGNANVGGSLDELAVWPIVLTQGNITTLWNSGAGTFAP